MGFRTSASWATFGTGGLFGLRKDQNRRSSPVRGSSESWPGSWGGSACAPAAIQRRRVSTSPVLGGLTRYLKRRSAGGISSCTMRWKRRLASGSPGTRAGPDLPPRRRPARVLRSRPPSWARLPWQTTHLMRKMGSTSFSLMSAWARAASAWPSRSIQPRMAAISSRPRAASPGGMAPDTTLSSSRLRSADPGTTAGPDLPPFRIEAGALRSSSAWGADSPWQATQLFSMMGRIDESKTSGAVSPVARTGAKNSGASQIIRRQTLRNAKVLPE